MLLDHHQLVVKASVEEVQALVLEEEGDQVAAQEEVVILVGIVVTATLMDQGEVVVGQQ